MQAEANAHEEVPPGHLLLAVVKDGRRISFALSTRVKSLLLLPWNEECKQLAAPICTTIAEFLESHPAYPMICVMGEADQAQRMTDSILALPSYQGKSVQEVGRLVGYQLTTATFIIREELDALEVSHFRRAVESDAAKFGALLQQFDEDIEQRFAVSSSPDCMWLSNSKPTVTYWLCCCCLDARRCAMIAGWSTSRRVREGSAGSYRKQCRVPVV